MVVFCLFCFGDGWVWNNLLFLSAKNPVPSLSTNHSSTSLGYDPWPHLCLCEPQLPLGSVCDSGVSSGKVIATRMNTGPEAIFLSCVVSWWCYSHHQIPWFSLRCFHYRTASPSTHHPGCKIWSLRAMWKELTESWNDQSWTFQVQKTSRKRRGCF